MIYQQKWKNLWQAGMTGANTAILYDIFDFLLDFRGINNLYLGESYTKILIRSPESSYGETATN